MTTTKKNNENVKKYEINFASTYNDKFFHKFEPNSVVLCKKPTNDGKTDYLYVTGLKNAEQLTIIKHLLFAYCVEFRQSLEHKKDTDNFTFEGVKHKDSIPMYSRMKPYFNTEKIYRTDSNGNLKEVLKCDTGTLRTNGFSFKKTENCAICEYQFIRAFVYNRAKHVETCLSWVANLNSNFNNAINAKPVTEKVEPVTEKVA